VANDGNRASCREHLVQQLHELRYQIGASSFLLINYENGARLLAKPARIAIARIRLGPDLDPRLVVLVDVNDIARSVEVRDCLKLLALSNQPGTQGAPLTRTSLDLHSIVVNRTYALRPPNSALIADSRRFHGVLALVLRSS
jgi:hypothetical protein